ncbi:MAG TPA: hypothetical protein PKA06_07300 [Gemmatales bacterium]|nr:hypothetical protein [Gemmatales bacterium]HMP17271.1 hypothetical protein [Gemmatales bacterium]
MKKYVLALLAGLALCLSTSQARADWVYWIGPETGFMYLWWDLSYDDGSFHGIPKDWGPTELLPWPPPPPPPLEPPPPEFDINTPWVMPRLEFVDIVPPPPPPPYWPTGFNYVFLQDNNNNFFVWNGLAFQRIIIP